MNYYYNANIIEPNALIDIISCPALCNGGSMSKNDIIQLLMEDGLNLRQANEYISLLPKMRMFFDLHTQRTSMAKLNIELDKEPPS